MIDHADNIIDLNAIFHPARSMASPRYCGGSVDIARRGALDPRSLGVGRAAVTSNPALRDRLGSNRLVTIDDVLEALAALDDHLTDRRTNFERNGVQPRWSGCQ